MTSGAEVADGHAQLLPRNELLACRRTLYSLAVELTLDQRVSEDDVDLLDCPVTRGLVGALLSGSAHGSPEAHAVQLCRISELASARSAGVGGRVPIVGRVGARRDLDGALIRVAEASGLPGQLVLVTEIDARFARLATDLDTAARLAESLVPSLAADLFPHIELVAFVADDAGKLGSASAREFPGLVVIPASSTVLDIVEALVHEGAHQKLFDLAIVCEMLPGPDTAPVYWPPWHGDGAAGWPLEQVLAAWHAYTCLCTLADAVAAAGDRAGTDSLLPEAADRSELLARWLAGHGEYLGADARQLVTALSGHEPSAPAARSLQEPLASLAASGDAQLVSRRAGRRLLVGTRHPELQLYWVRRDD
jgi:hypothetical protein